MMPAKAPPLKPTLPSANDLLAHSPILKKKLDEKKLAVTL